jgi:hypothetical protein
MTILTRVSSDVEKDETNNSLAISWWSALLVEEIEIPGRIHRLATGH